MGYFRDFDCDCKVSLLDFVSFFKIRCLLAIEVTVLVTPHVHSKEHF